jgi:NADH pyrophosphatase NudC (nudix superfamily)
MADQHPNVRPLFEFCPHDATKLRSLPDPEGTPRPTCPRCGFADYRNPKPCVEALVEQDGRLLLGRRGIEPSKGMWDILGGFMHAGESVEEALRREVHEESGLHVRMGRFLGSFPGSYGGLQEAIIVLCFTARPEGGSLTPATDVAELCWFAPEDLPRDMAFPHQRGVIGLWRSGKD